MTASEKLFIITVVLFVGAGCIPASADNASSFVWGRFDRLIQNSDSFEITERGKDKQEIFRFDKNTKFHRTDPGSTTPSSFKKGEPLVVKWRRDGKTRLALRVWERKAFFLQMARLSTELLLTGEIVSIDSNGKTLEIKPPDGRRIKIGFTPDTRTIINNAPGKPGLLKQGSKAAIFCIWAGFPENRPLTPEASVIMDARSFVIQSFSIEFGGTFLPGRVASISSSNREITLETGRGQRRNAVYDNETRWITASSRIGAISDFTGQKVLLFGETAKSQIKARMVLNEPGVLSMFEMMARQGGSGTTSTILAKGPVVLVNPHFITAGAAPWDLRLVLTKSTRIYRNNRLISASQLKAGEIVTVRGTLASQPVASTITVEQHR